LTEFNAIKIKPEDVNEFMKRFNKLYNSLPVEIKPPLTGEKVVFAGAFEYDFGFTLRERRYPTLDQIQIYALEIEATLFAAGKIKPKEQVEDKSKGKEEVKAVSQPKYYHEKKLEEMTKFIRNLSGKLVKMELEGKNPPKTDSTGPKQKF